MPNIHSKNIQTSLLVSFSVLPSVFLSSMIFMSRTFFKSGISPEYSGTLPFRDRFSFFGISFGEVDPGEMADVIKDDNGLFFDFGDRDGF